MKIAIGYDPNATAYSREVKAYVEQLGHEAYDMGSDDPIYANTAVKLAEAVTRGDYDRGILICGTGIGMSIAANKVKGAYAACVSNVYQGQRAELSNNANIITLGAQVTGIELAKCIIKEYLQAAFDPTSRSAPKLKRIYEYEEMHA